MKKNLSLFDLTEEQYEWYERNPERYPEITKNTEDFMMHIMFDLDDDEDSLEGYNWTMDD